MTSYTIHYHTFDMLIVGSGGAGLMAAYQASTLGARVALITKTHPLHSHTVAAQGGINAALGGVEEDHWHYHMYDTLHGSDWLADRDVVEFMCREAKDAIIRLEHLGVPFSRLQNGKLYQRQYGGQSTHFGEGHVVHRACSAADRTGHAILNTLYQHSLRLGVSVFEYHFALNLIMDGQNRCQGIVTWELESGDIHVFLAPSILIATGGYSQIYQTNTSSSACTGDGNAMALRAGLPLQDMEFVQFHPTGLFGSGYLITEAARGEGGYLLNSDGERFMERYDPSFRDLACRDVITRAIAQEIAEGRGIGEHKDHVHLSLLHLSTELLHDKLPHVIETVGTFKGLNPASDFIPVSPTAHYTMGGIPANIHGQVLNYVNNIAQPVQGLFALGETACMSVHGANRLGCNSLLDLMVFGHSIPAYALASAQSTSLPRPHPDLAEPSILYLERLRMQKGSVSINDTTSTIKTTMQQNVGVYRHQQSLEQSLALFMTMLDERQDWNVGDSSRIWNNALLAAFECDNLLLQAIATTKAALMRKESRGSHFRHDFPDRNDNEWRAHSLVSLDTVSARTQCHYTMTGVRDEPLDPTSPQFIPQERKHDNNP